MDAEIRKEFYGPAEAAQLGDPAADPPLTVRMQPPVTWGRRFSPITPRVVKVGPDQWCEVFDRFYWRGDEEVADWPVQHPLEYGLAMRKTLGPLQPGRASAAQPTERGDMDVEAFRG